MERRLDWMKFSGISANFDIATNINKSITFAHYYKYPQRVAANISVIERRYSIFEPNRFTKIELLVD